MNSIALDAAEGVSEVGHVPKNASACGQLLESVGGHDDACDEVVVSFLK
jgi:hypothetical protein